MHNLRLMDKVTNDVHELQLWFIGKGTFGCVYDVISTVALTHGATPLPSHSVAKTPRLDVSSPNFDAQEIEGLDGIHELYAYGPAYDTKDPHHAQKEFVVMMKHSGVNVLATDAWMHRFPENYNTDRTPHGIASCDHFMNQLYKRVIDKIAWYAEVHGYEPSDLNWGNFLFSNDVQTVNIIDWGRAAQTGQDLDVIQELKDFYLDGLATYAMLPLRDTTERTVNVQGICQSDMRDGGAAFWNPML